MAQSRKRAHELYVAGKLADAIAAVHDDIAHNNGQASTDDLKFLAHLHFAKGEVPEALKYAHVAHDRAPDDGETIKNIGVCLIRLRREREAVGWLEKAIALDDGDAAVHDTLCHALGNLGDLAGAKRHGERALELKADAAARLKPVRDLAKVAVPAFRADRPHRNVIAFSLWGNDMRYCAGAVANARLAPEIYPEWRCRFYCDASVPSSTIGELLSLGADVVMMPDGQRLHEGLFWRFQVCWDKGVDRYLIRDADSIINLKERLAVAAWLDSGKHFHIMRDFHSHTDLVLAGMWGGVGGALPDLNAQIDRYLDDIAKPRTCDQNFLREIVWPVMRQSYLMHDSLFEVLDAQPYPPHAALPPGRHVGQNAVAHAKPVAGSMAAMTARHQTKPMEPRRRFVFTITTGRTGTAYLAQLLSRNMAHAEVHHERTGYQNLGVLSPDASHNTLFNSLGNVPDVQAFWRRKLASMRYGPGDTYVETSHFLAKAGLIENLDNLGEDAEIHLVQLNRNVDDVVWSLANRMEFANLGFTWLFALDPRYPRNIVNAAPFQSYGLLGSCYWYVVEMAVRAAYYRRVMASVQNVTFHAVDLEEIVTGGGAAALLSALGSPPTGEAPVLPERQNERRTTLLSDKDRAAVAQMITALPFDADTLAGQFIATGRKLG